MTPQFKIINKENIGFAVYYKTKTWYGKVIWKPYLTYYGGDDVYYFSTFVAAQKELSRTILQTLQYD